MPLAFECVSYSYDAPKSRKKRAKSFSQRHTGGAHDPQAPQANASADWDKGNPNIPTTPRTPQANAPSDGKRVWALHDVSFTLDDGEFLGLAGHTGSGKSTLIQHANGLLHPTEGRVLFDGADLSDKKTAQTCRSAVGLVFQYPEHQLFAATVYEDVAFGPRNLGLDDEEVARRVSEALRLVHLDEADVAQRSPFELSGGQQRRVAFAGVLAMQPRVLVMDEPVAGLDPVAREEFLELIEELHRHGLSIMMASHSMEDLARLADRILVLDHGESRWLGAPQEVFSHVEELREIGLNAPAAQQFAEELRHAGFALPEKLYDAASLADALAQQLQSAPAQPTSTHPKER